MRRLGKNYLLCLTPVLLKKDKYTLSSYQDTCLCSLLSSVWGYCWLIILTALRDIASRKPDADSSNNANWDSFVFQKEEKITEA